MVQYTNETKIQYFGYGANRDFQMMAAITGNENLTGRLAEIRGYELCVQEFDQVPTSVQGILREAGWNNKNFSTYVIRPKEGSVVYGMIWELTGEERSLVKNWEIIGPWYKEIRCEVMGNVITGEKKRIQAITEQLGDGQEIDRVVDGRTREIFLNNRDMMFEVAKKAREQYLEIEGRIPGKER